MKWFRSTLLAGFAALLVAGCRSAKPPPPPPQSVTVAERLGSQAEGLSEQGNWTAAANAWKKAGEQFALLNDLKRQATALHNQGQAELEQDHFEPAAALFIQAAELNQKTHANLEWWRNQIGLLQAEASLTHRSQQLESRFEELTTKAKDLQQPVTEALFLNELGLWQRRQKKFQDAEATFKAAREKFEAAKHATGVAVVLSNQALLAEDSTRFAEAETLWRLALQHFEKLAEPAGIARALAGLGRSLCGQEKEPSQAADFLRRASTNFTLLKKGEEAKAALAKLAACLEKQGKTDEASKVQKELQQLSP